MMLLWRLCGIAIITAILSLFFKKTAGGQAIPLAIIGLFVLLLPLLTHYGEAAKTLLAMLKGSDLDSYGSLMLKALGIGITVRLAGDFCRGLGEDALAGTLELAGKLEILLLCLPLMRELLGLIREMMG